MAGIDDFFEAGPYNRTQVEKEKLMVNELKKLTAYHSENCEEYRRYLNAIGYDEASVKSTKDVPFFPVRLFKEKDLVSVPKEEIIKTTMSSGTTGQKVSRMHIDKTTAALQQKITVKQLTNFWGKKRLPFLIVDSEETVKNRTKFSARAAGIMGLRFFATDMAFLLDEKMRLNRNVLDDFLGKYGENRFIVFGFTFMVWQHLYKELNRCDQTVDMSKAILMTGGGLEKV